MASVNAFSVKKRGQLHPVEPPPTITHKFLLHKWRYSIFPTVLVKSNPRRSSRTPSVRNASFLAMKLSLTVVFRDEADRVFLSSTMTSPRVLSRLDGCSQIVTFFVAAVEHFVRYSFPSGV